MPAQPLSSVCSKAGFGYGPKVLEERPALAVYVAKIISIWAIAEYKWASIFVDLLKAEARMGAVMYQALSGAEARRSVLEATAKERLSEDDFLLFKAVVKATSIPRRIRNEFAHHIWGYSDDLTNKLLLIDPECLHDHDVAMAELNAEMVRTGKLKLPPDVDKTRVYVYGEKELIEAVSVVEEGLQLVVDLWIPLHLTSTLGQPRIDDRMRRQLLSRPQVEQAFQRMKKQNGL